jgi:hypothetical protein
MMATLPSASRYRRSRIWREVTFLPSRPASGHGQRRRVDRGGGQRARQVGGADGLRHGRVGQAGDGNDVAGGDLVDRHPLQAAEGEQFGQAAGLNDRAIEPVDLHRHVDGGAALFDAAGQHAAKERVRFQNGGDHAERRALIERRGGDVREDEVEQRVEVFARVVERLDRPALAAGGEQHREIQLILVGVEGREQVEHLVMHIVRPGVAAVDLVDHHHGLQATGQRLAQHELGLRQYAFGGVDQDHGAVDHVQNTLDLAAEIGVAWRVDDVDAHVFPDDRRAFGEDGDAPFFFEVVAVERAFSQRLVGGERAGLAQQLVDEGGFAVIDMGDDGNITNLGRGHARQPDF